MANALRHKDAATAVIADDPAADVKLSWWNKEHQFAGGAQGSLLQRDTGSTDGASWVAAVALGQVLISQGTGVANAFSARPALEGIVYPLSDPASPPNGLLWISTTGTTPTGTVSLKVRVQGITVTLVSVSF